MRITTAFALVLAFTGRTVSATAPSVPVNANWMTRHMAEEHHISMFDEVSFFTLHDFNSNGLWEVDELQRTYGVFDESNSHMSAEQRDDIGHRLMRLLDTDGDGVVSRDEWLQFISHGNELPDLGTGSGHHGDEEYEYEVHHWEKYHNEDSPVEELNHPEDIQHFRRHDEAEAEGAQGQLEGAAVIEANIPGKFRRYT